MLQSLLALKGNKNRNESAPRNFPQLQILMDKLVTSATASTIGKQDADDVVEVPIQKVSVPKIAIASSSEDEASAPAAKEPPATYMTPQRPGHAFRHFMIMKHPTPSPCFAPSAIVPATQPQKRKRDESDLNISIIDTSSIEKKQLDVTPQPTSKSLKLFDATALKELAFKSRPVGPMPSDYRGLNAVLKRSTRLRINQKQPSESLKVTADASAGVAVAALGDLPVVKEPLLQPSKLKCKKEGNNAKGKRATKGKCKDTVEEPPFDPKALSHHFHVNE